LIIDSHSHIFPFLDGPCGFPTREDHMRVMQLYMVGHSQPVRRLKDHVVVREPTLSLEPPLGPESLFDVNFRVTRNGRFEWTKDGVDYYIHFMPPSLQCNASPAEFILTQMAYVGVDVSVLQNAHLYGRLNDYLGEAVKRYPDKLIALACVDELKADTEDEMAELKRAVRILGLKGLYYANRGFFPVRYRWSFDDPRYEPFWELVRELRIPVFWELFAVPDMNDLSAYRREMRRLLRWCERYPDVPCVLTHGIGVSHLSGPSFPELEALFGREQVSIELLYPIGWGRDHEYPYPELQPAIRTLYQRVGASRLVWGSDMPNVERNCTYRQSLDYLRKHCDFIPSADMELILGGNLARMFGLH